MKKEILKINGLEFGFKVDSNGKEYITSLEVAERFEKRHDSLLRTIRESEAYDEFVNAHEIVAVKYKDAKGEERPMFLLGRDAFSFFVMGFTGKKAARWKLDYIKAFNYMERIIKERATVEWQKVRIKGKTTRRLETDQIKNFVVYAGEQGSKNPEKYYVHFTNLVNKAIGVEKGMRDKLPYEKLRDIEFLENSINKQLETLMNKKMFYKEIYKEIKENIQIATEKLMIKD